MSRDVIIKELMQAPSNYPATYYKNGHYCGCCVFPRFHIVELAGGNQRVDRIADRVVSLCRGHRAEERG